MPLILNGEGSLGRGKIYFGILSEKWRGRNKQEKESSAKGFWDECYRAVSVFPAIMDSDKDKSLVSLENAATSLKNYSLTCDFGEEALRRLAFERWRYLNLDFVKMFRKESGYKSRGRLPDERCNGVVAIIDILLRKHTKLRPKERHVFIREQVNGLFGKYVTLGAIGKVLDRMPSEVKRCYEMILNLFRKILSADYSRNGLPSYDELVRQMRLSSDELWLWFLKESRLERN